MKKERCFLALLLIVAMLCSVFPSAVLAVDDSRMREADGSGTQYGDGILISDEEVSEAGEQKEESLSAEDVISDETRESTASDISEGEDPSSRETEPSYEGGQSSEEISSGEKQEGTAEGVDDISEKEGQDSPNADPSSADGQSTEEVSSGAVSEELPELEDPVSADAEEKQGEEESVVGESMSFSSSGNLSPGLSTIYIPAGETVYYSFSPASSGEYRICSISDTDTVGYLLDNGQEVVTFDDDGGAGNNFNLLSSLSADQTYYIGCRFYNSSQSGNISLAVALCGKEGTNNVSIRNDETGFLSFTAPSDGEYVFFSSTGIIDTFGSLYDEDCTFLSSDDDGGEEQDFCIRYFLNAGKTYYLEVNCGGMSGEIPTSVMPVCTGEDLSLNVSEGETAYFAFFVGEEGEYEFYSTSDKDTVGYLYDLGMNQLGYDDDSGEGTNFRITRTLESSEAVIVGAAFYNSSFSGELPVHAARIPDMPSMGEAVISVSDQTFTGKDLTPKPTVKLGDRTLIMGTDYQVSYKNNKKAGTAILTVTGIDGIIGTKSVKFKINPRSVTKTSVSIKSQTYSGTAKKPTPVLKIGSYTVNKANYTVTFKNNVNAGKATVTITGTRNLKGKVSKTFTIAKAKPKLTFSAKAVTRERNQKAFTNKLTKKTDGKVKYTSSKKSVATVNSKTGLVTIRGRGTTTIKVTAAAGKNYKSGTASYKLTVLKAGAFRWDRDNWSFTNSYSSFGYYKKYSEMISASYVNKLKANLNNSEYRYIFSTSNGWIYDNWSGSCHGMSSVAFLSKEKLVPYGSYQSGAKMLSQLKRPIDNMKVSSLITYYQMLQIKDAVQQMFNWTLKRSNKENIQTILKTLDKHSTTVVGFRADGFGGHTVLAYDYEYGSYKWFGKSYQGRILICDPNASDAYNEYFNIYFDKNTYSWIIPAYYNSFGTRGRFNLVSSDKKLINGGGYLKNGANMAASNYIARLNAYEAADGHSISKVRISEDNGRVMNVESNDIEKEEFYLNSDGAAGTPGYNLYDASSAYRFTQPGSDPLNLSLRYDNCYLEAKSGAGTSVLFNRDGRVELKGKAADCRLAMTFNEDYPTDWFTVEVSGKGVSSITLKKTKEGYLVSGNNLKNLKISVNNRESTVTKTLSTSSKKALICQKADGTLEIRPLS